MAYPILVERIRSAVADSASKAYADQLRHLASKQFVRDTEAETAILKDWAVSYQYARNVLQGRWPEFERVMDGAKPSIDAVAIRSTYNYARYVAGERLEAVEKHVARDATTAVDYAKDVLGREWVPHDEHFEAAIASISNHPTALAAYQREVRVPPTFVLAN